MGAEGSQTLKDIRSNFDELSAFGMILYGSFDSNPANKWYKAMGLAFEAPTEPLTFPNSYELSSRYMVTPPGVTALHVAECLMTENVSLQYPVSEVSDN